MSQSICFNNDSDEDNENEFNYELLLSKLLQINLNQTATQLQNLDNILNTFHNLCKAIKLNKNFVEFLKKFNSFTQNLEKFRQFSCLKQTQHNENLVENVEHLLKLYNCYNFLIIYLNSNQNLVSSSINHVIIFVRILFDLIKIVLTYLNTHSQQHPVTSSQVSTQQATQTVTQIVRSSFNNNSTLLNLIKIQNDLINESCKLIEIIINKQLTNDEICNKSDVVSLSDSLIGVIKTIKNDAKLMIILWKILSKYLIKNQKLLESSVNLYDYLAVLNDEINLNLTYLKAKNNTDNEIANQNLAKIIKICALFFKLYKSILVAYASNINENVLSLLNSIIMESNFIAQSDLYLKQLKFEFLCEFKPIIKHLIQFLLTNFRLDFMNYCCF